jgi:hypothetical protein
MRGPSGREGQKAEVGGCVQEELLWDEVEVDFVVTYLGT